MTGKDQDSKRKKAEAMQGQAQRAETPYLRAMYQSIADQWSNLVDEVQDASKPAAPQEGQ